MFVRANASERAAILHNLAESPLKASPRVPQSRAARSIAALEMAAFVTDVENFTRELSETLILPAGIAARGRERPRRRAARHRHARARHAERDLPTRAVVPQARDRQFRSQRLSAGAALRAAERARGAGDAGGLARLDHAGRARQVPLGTLRRRAAARARCACREAAHRAAGLRTCWCAPARTIQAANHALLAPDRESAGRPGLRSRRSRRRDRSGSPLQAAPPPTAREQVAASSA